MYELRRLERVNVPSLLLPSFRSLLVLLETFQPPSTRYTQFHPSLLPSSPSPPPTRPFRLPPAAMSYSQVVEEGGESCRSRPSARSTGKTLTERPAFLQSRRVSVRLLSPKTRNQLHPPSHSFLFATAHEIAFERKEEEQQRAQQTLNIDAAVLWSFPPLLALHLSLGLPDALFAKKQQLVEESLEKLVGLMTDGSTGEKVKAARRLPESNRVALGLGGRVDVRMEGWELIKSVARRLKERFDQAQHSSSSNPLGNGSTTSSSPLSDQTTRLLIFTHYLIGRISSPWSHHLFSSLPTFSITSSLLRFPLTSLLRTSADRSRLGGRIMTTGSGLGWEVGGCRSCRVGVLQRSRGGLGLSGEVVGGG
ncbi:hypothetical protein BDY24DRAFT_392018 [Mrakia frigida]|uniref:uncharacterized protein n=1 Tax=Mrakia frigida TaxID=29902 RepID=UPI003FCC1823